MIGQFDGWLLGPTLGVNYGGIKNTHDGMCVHGSHERYENRKWEHMCYNGFLKDCMGLL